MLTRRRLFTTVPAIGALSASYAFGVEPRWFETVVQPVWIPGLKGPVRILHLSDLHASFEVPFSLLTAAIDQALEIHSDIICLTGDFISRDEPIDWHIYSKLLKRLSSAAPTYACLGNHDGGFWAQSRGGHADPSRIVKLLADSDITLLQNRNVAVETKGSAFQLAGVGDLWNHEVNAAAALSKTPSELPVILLAHNPDTKDYVSGYRWDLMLSGHTHGGQVLVPLTGDAFIPVEDKRFISGLKQWRGRQVYVTRGVGSLAGVRFRCRPEITILDLQG